MNESVLKQTKTSQCESHNSNYVTIENFFKSIHLFSRIKRLEHNIFLAE